MLLLWWWGDCGCWTEVQLFHDGFRHYAACCFSQSASLQDGLLLLLRFKSLVMNGLSSTRPYTARYWLPGPSVKYLINHIIRWSLAAISCSRRLLVQYTAVCAVQLCSGGDVLT
jgi:hypothetical protein